MNAARSRVWKLSFALMAGVMLAYTLIQSPVLAWRVAMARAVPWNETAMVILGTFFVALNVPLSLLVAKRIRLRQRRWLMVTLWTAAMFALQLVAVVVQNVVQRAFWPGAEWISFSTLFPVAIVLDSATAVGLLFAVLAIENREAARLTALRAEQLRALARDEEHNALLAQLHPHFLFNTLNAIAALMRTDPATARTTVAQLRTLIEQHIESAPPMWTVAEEIHVVATYLDIEKRRFGERLQVMLDIAPEARGAAFPRLLLQPLVENAVRHGARGGGGVFVSVNRAEDGVQARVRDTGTFGKSIDGSGVGLKNVRARLDLLYGDRHHFEIAQGDAGTCVSVTVPAA